MKYYILLLLSITSSCWSFVFYNAQQQYQDQVAAASEIVFSCQEASVLWNEIWRDGPIQIVAVNGVDQDFEACWEGQGRRILVNMKQTRSFASIVASIVFEMHNAKNNRRLEALYNLVEQRAISLQDFAVKIERIEYENLTEALRLLRLGQMRGLYPKEAKLPEFSSFEEYLQVQEQMGHTDYHRQVYRNLSM